MSGLLAIFNSEGLTLPLAPMLARFPSHAARRDEWRDRHCALARLHHGIANPMPQPVWNADHSLCLVCDGEFFPTGDPELDGPDGRPTPATCLRLYEDGRFEAFARLNGSFALIVYAPLARELTLISDRHGSRPLFYFRAGREVVVSSFVAALTVHPRCPRRLDRQALHELLLFQRMIGDRTLYDQVSRLPPASLLGFIGERVASRSYWALRWRQPDFAKRDAPALLAESIKRAVRRRQEPSLRHGLLLSGGRDSRLLLAAAAEPPPPCFTLSTTDNAEVRIARRAAALRGAAFHFLQVEPELYWDHFDQSVRLSGGMHRAHAGHFLPVLDQVRRHCDTLLTGYGMDTIYRGIYLPAWRLHLGGHVIRLPPLRAVGDAMPAAAIVKSLSYTQPLSALARILTESARREQRSRAEQAIADVLQGFQDPGSPRQNAWDYVQLHAIGRLDAYPNVLSVRARMNDRVVALDRDLFDLYLRMPPDWRHPDRINRAVLRRLAPPALARLAHVDTTLPADLSLETEIALRLLKFAGQRLYLWPRPRPAHPLATDRGWPDFNALLRRHAPFRGRIEALSTNESLLACGLFEPSGLRQVVREHLDGKKNYGRLLLILLTLESWLRQFGNDGIN